MNKKRAFTLVEVVVAAAIMVLLIGAGFQLFQKGSQSAGKGSEYLANALAAGNLARRLELDIEVAESLEIAGNEKQGEIRIKFDVPGEHGKLQRHSVIYSWPADNGRGIKRNIENQVSAIFCGDRIIETLKLTRHEFAAEQGAYGYQIDLTLTGKTSEAGSPQTPEKVNIKRFATAFNGSSARLAPGYNYWK